MIVDSRRIFFAYYKKVISIQIMTEVSMLLYSERRNVQCFTLSLPQHVYVLSAVLFPRSRPATLTNGYAFPGNEPEPLIACDLATCPRLRQLSRLYEAQLGTLIPRPVFTVYYNE